MDRRFAKGLFLGVAYTWGKCLTMASADGDAGRIDNLTKLANYGPCSFDVRQNLTFNFVYQLPGVTGHGSLDNRVTRAILNGWQVSGITVFRNDAPSLLVSALGASAPSSSPVRGPSGLG